MLILSSKISSESYTEEDMEFIDTLCKIAGIAIDNARLYEEATYDFKTGLYLYKNFKDRANKELSRTLRFSQDLSAIMVDIDFFKKVNDNYGHDAGDSVLTCFGEIIRQGIREFDIPGRFGGEEFVIICPNTDLEQAENLCQRLQDVIRGYSFPANDNFIKVTSSFGISQLKESDDGSLDKLIKRADEALYLSKKNGRDRITLSE
jgi:diguanylate cyclase (GGDEF)-like protein